MFDLTYKDLRNPDFLSGVSKITGHSGYKEFKTAYHISRIGAELRSAAKEAEEVFLQLVKAHGEVKGKAFEIPEDNRDAWQKAVDEYLAHKLTIKKNPVKIKEIEGVGLSPKEIDALTPLLAGLEAL